MPKYAPTPDLPQIRPKPTLLPTGRERGSATYPAAMDHEHKCSRCGAIVWLGAATMGTPAEVRFDIEDDRRTLRAEHHRCRRKPVWT